MPSREDASHRFAMHVGEPEVAALELAGEALVDRLLASPRYGERMARHWLDLVRYADGDGYRADDYRPDAWRFRDYVIRAFNDDKPYDRFVCEQLAGDELFPGDPAALVATGYLRHGIYEWNARDVRGQWDTILNDLTDTTADVFLGLGMQCARCHDHKFDPILQKDYFRLRAFFAPFQPGDRIAATAAEVTSHAERSRVWEEKTAALRAELATLEQPYFDKAERIAVGRFPDDIQAMILKPAARREPLEAQLAVLAWRQVEVDWARRDGLFSAPDKERILALRRELAAFEKEKPAPLPVAFAAGDVGPAAPPVFIPKKAGSGRDRARLYHAARSCARGHRTAARQHRPPRRARELADHAGESARGARDREPRVAAALRTRARGQCERLWKARRKAVASRAARLAHRLVCPRGVEHEKSCTGSSSRAPRIGGRASIPRPTPES